MQLDLFPNLDEQSLECHLWDMLVALPQVEVPDTTLSTPSRKWRAISAYQKAIRRSDVPTAVMTAVAVYKSEPDYFLRRNSVVMFEDIGPANINLCAASLLLYQRRKELKVSGLQLVANFAAFAAQQKKDRACCWVAVSSWFPQASKARRDFFAQQNHDHPLAVFETALDESQPILDRYQSISALYGKLAHRLDSKDVPKQQPRRKLFDSLIDQLVLPDAIAYSVRVGAALGLEGLPFALPFLYKFAQQGVVEEMEIPAPETIAGLPSYAYDQHVLEGRRALSRFTYRTGVRSWLEANNFKVGDYAVTGVLAFEYEGGNILHNWLAYPESKTLLQTARCAHLESAGLTPQQGEDGRSILLDNLHKLNECRLSEATR